MAEAYLVPTPQPSGNLVRGAALGTMEDMMDNKKQQRADDQEHTDGSTGDGGPIKDKAWSQVDLRKDEKTPEADLPSDIEPHES